MNIIKTIVGHILDRLPANIKQVLLGTLAALPPKLRTVYSYRLALRILLHYQHKTEVFKTNMGISRAFRCELPYDLSPCAVWGTPRFELGEWNSMRLTGHLTGLCDAFVDVGSYVGYYIFYVWHQTQGNIPIYYFEPVQKHFNIITHNIATSRLTGVVGYEVAMGAYDGTAEFFVNNTYASCGSLTDRYASRDDITRIVVPVITFSSFITSTQHRKVCVKVDVESAEQLFLDGVGISLDRLTYLVVEVLDAQSQFLINAKNLEFEVYHILPSGLRWRPEGVDEYVHGHWNWLICRQKPTELDILLKGSGLCVVD